MRRTAGSEEPDQKSSGQRDWSWMFPAFRDDTEPQANQDVSIGRDDGGEIDLAHDHIVPPTDFPVSMKALVGQELRLRRTSKGLGPYGAWELTAASSSRPVAWLRLYGRGGLAAMACREGTWSLKKRRKYGWELLIESSDGRRVGWYSGRHWLPGGTIILTSGARVDLRRSRTLGWKLQMAETREQIAEISRCRSAPLSLRVMSLPTEIYLEVPSVIVTACAVLLLGMTPVPGASGG